MADVSFIVPVYKVPKEYLKKCVESLINQTYKDIEIILIDDGSPDECGKICDEYAKIDKRIYVLHKKNEGLSNARNSGLEIAKGRWISFVDGDDWIDINLTKTVLEKVKNCKKEEISVVIFNHIYEYGKYQRIRDLYYDFDEKKHIVSGNNVLGRIVGPSDEEINKIEYNDMMVHAWGKFYKKDVIENIEFIDSKIIGTCEDYMFNVTVFSNVKNVFLINDGMYHYNKINSNSLTKNYDVLLYEKRKKMYELTENILNTNMSADINCRFKNRRIMSLIPIFLKICNSNMKFMKKNIEIKKILKDKYTMELLKNYKLNKMTFFYKIYFFLCKIKFSSLIVIYTKLIIKIKNRR